MCWICRYGAGSDLLGCAALIRYNAWTAGLRERHPNFNPPPTPEWRVRNTKIMTVIFRIAGVFFFLLSILSLLTLVGSAARSH